MTMKKQPGDGGISEPTMYDTIEQARVAAQAQSELDARVAAMTPQERAAWLANIAGSSPQDVE